MNHFVRKLVTGSAVSALAFGAVVVCSGLVNADTKIAISEKNFPDEKFRNYLKNQYYDKDKDGYLSSDEIKKIKSIYRESEGIKDLTGIELFTELETLIVSENELTEVDLSKNTKLKKLEIDDNKLDKLDVSKNTELEVLECQRNLLKTLDLSKNTNLQSLNVGNNKLDKLDLSKNTELLSLGCGYNSLETIDLSKNTKLTDLYIYNSKLKTLDLSNNTELFWLYVDNNKLEKLDLSKNTKLVHLECCGNLLKTLDLSKQTKLSILRISKNKIEKLDLSKNTGLTYLSCEENLLKVLDISKNPDLYHLFCQGNQIDKVDVSNCEKLARAVLAGDIAQENGYVVYSGALAVDNKTVVIDKPTVDDNTKQIYLYLDATIPIGFDGADSKTKVTMTSSDDSIVKIGDNNTLVTLKAGSSDITAKVGDKEYKFKVTVYYKDVKDNTKFWFEPTYALTEKGVVKGYDNQTKFKPANKCTRAQMVTFIWRLAGSPEPKTKECKFSDVKKSDYFYKACLWGNENHIVEGYKDCTFGPQIVCARRHAVTFLWRLAGKPEPNIDKIKFDDVFEDINEEDYFYKACLWASEKKIVAGYDDNTFRPDGDCLRRQMVTFLYKFDKYVGVK